MSEKIRSKSMRKFIRLEKARIRREICDFKKQEEAIQKFYQELSNKKPVVEKKAVKAKEPKKAKKTKVAKKSK